MADIDWRWLTGSAGPLPDHAAEHPAGPGDGREVLHTMIDRCDTAAALVSGSSGSSGMVLVDPMEVARSVGEVATMLVAAGIEMKDDADPQVAAIATRLHGFGRRCQRVVRPFVRGETGPDRRDQVWRVLQDVTAFLRELLADPPATRGGTSASASGRSRHVER